MLEFSDPHWRQSLIDLRASVPYLYAQWLYEDPNSLEYRVAVSAGEESYEIAHRSGIIGQVFRTGATMFVSNVCVHPLYDTYDSRITWEWAGMFGAVDGTRLVLNLEGQDHCNSATLPQELHFLFRGLPLRTFPANAPADMPILCADPNALLQACVTLAEAGQWVAAIGHFPDLAPSNHVTYQEALKNNLPLAECIFPYKPRLDLFLLNSSALTDLSLALKLLGNGRYHILIAQGNGVIGQLPTTTGK
jgi:hypothetical protein